MIENLRVCRPSWRLVEAIGPHQGRRSYVFFWVLTHPLFRSWVRMGIGPTHFLRWIVYYCVCIQHDIDKSQISFTELCKTLRTNSGLRAINSCCLHVFWPQLCLCNRSICAVSYILRLRSLDPPTFLHRSTPLALTMNNTGTLYWNFTVRSLV